MEKLLGKVKTLTFAAEVKDQLACRGFSVNISVAVNQACHLQLGGFVRSTDSTLVQTYKDHKKCSPKTTLQLKFPIPTKLPDTASTYVASIQAQATGYTDYTKNFEFNLG